MGSEMCIRDSKKIEPAIVIIVEELQPRAGQDDELVLMGLIQLILRERERG